MTEHSCIYIGIHLASGRRPFTFTAFNQALELETLGEGEIEDVLSFAAGKSNAFIGINSPAQPNQGLVNQKETRQSLFPELDFKGNANMRAAEFQLMQSGFNIQKTAAHESDCPSWIRLGFSLYEQLHKLGYQTYPDAESPKQILEVQSEAAYWYLLEKCPLFQAKSIEGRIQRQLALFELDLPISDPMQLFVEITRYRLMKGIFPAEQIRSYQELSAMLCAYTAWLADNHSQLTVQIGAEEEGCITLPKSLPELKANIRRK